MADVDVVLAFSPLESVVFERPTLVLPVGSAVVTHHLSSEAPMPDAPIAGILKELVPAGSRPARVALVGSGIEASSAINALLSGPDGRHVDSVLVTDVSAPQGPAAGTLDVEAVVGFAAIAHLAAIGGRLVAFAGNNATTTESVSSTDVTQWLWRDATGSEMPRFDHAAPNGLLNQLLDPIVSITHADGQVTALTNAPLTLYTNRGTLWAYYYAAIDDGGEIDKAIEAQTLSAFVTELLAPRWNAIAPLDPICLSSKPDICHRSTFLSDAYLAGTAEPAPLDLDHHANPSLVGPAGQPPPAAPDETSKVLRWVGGILAATVVVELFRRGAKAFVNHTKRAARSSALAHRGARIVSAHQLPAELT